MKIKTAETVADTLGLTPQRVNQIVKELGITRADCPCCGAKERGITDADVRKIEKRKTSKGPEKKGRKK
jgi:predicted transcriptional regulator